MSPHRACGAVEISRMMPMKTHKHLYPLITEFENLRLAFKHAARGKRSSPNVAAFEFDLERNLLDLKTELEAHTYAPGAYYDFHIYDPKPRLISAAPFRDRVAIAVGNRHALCNIIQPLFERRFIFDSRRRAANRKGRGTHAALDRAYQKQLDADDVLVCYCFRHTLGSIRAEIEATRRSTEVDAINAGIQAGQCAGDIRNPQGSCCLGNVRAIVKRLG